MVNVPIVQRTVEDKPLPSARYSSSVDTSKEGLGISNLASSMENIIKTEKDRADTVSLIDTQKKLDDWEAKNIYDARTGALARKGKDAFDLPNVLGQQFDKDMAGIRDGLGNTDQQTAFEKMVQARRDNVMRTLYTHERSQMEDYAKETVKAATDSSVNRAALSFDNPKEVEAAINNAKAAQIAFGHTQGLPDEAIRNNVLEAESKAHIAILSRWADTDPKKALDYFKANQDKFTGPDLLAANKLMVPTERKYKAMDAAQNALAEMTPKVNRDDVIGFVMNNLEGGDKVVADGNGAIAKFGINSKANPDLDVASLTPDQARQRFVEKYWNAIDGDTLPPEMRLPAMSFVATSEPQETLRLLVKAQNDPDKFQQLAAEFYQDLATKNPEKYAGNLKGWMDRLSTVSSQVSSMRGELPNVFELNNRIDSMTDDPQVASDAKEIINKQVEALRKARKDANDAANQEAWKYKAAGMEVPPSVVARMDAKDAIEMQKNAPPDPALYEDTRQKLLAGIPVDLGSMRWRLGSKYDDLVEMQGDPTKRVNARKVDDVIDSAGQILLGKTKPVEQTDFEKIELFRRVVNQEIDSYQKTTGKAATGDDVQKIADRLLIKVSTGWFSSKKLFSIKPDEQFEVDGIPSGRKTFFSGVEIDKKTLLNKIVLYLQQENRPLDEANIHDTYKRLVNQKVIVEKAQ